MHVRSELSIALGVGLKKQPPGDHVTFVRWFLK
jgi:hypothetical protein